MATPKEKTPKEKTEAEEAAALMGETIKTDAEIQAEKDAREVQALREELDALRNAPQKTPGQIKLAAHRAICEEKAASLYAIQWKRKGHSQQTGKALESWKRQSMQPREFDAFCKSAPRLGFEFQVLSKPKNL